MYERMPTIVIPKQNIFSCKIDPNCISKEKKKSFYLLYVSELAKDRELGIVQNREH